MCYSRSENDLDLLESTPSTKAYLIGLCTGLLAAAAAAAARSTTELLQLAPEIVAIALRLALETSHRSVQLERSTDSWAVVVGGVSAEKQQKAINDFHVANVSMTEVLAIAFNADGLQAIPLCKHAYISAFSESSTTISGPPSTLNLLFSSSEILSTTSKVKLPISAAFHARHLGKPDVEKIIGSSQLHNASLKKNTYIMSTGSAAPYVSDTLRDLLRHVVDDILQVSLYWNDTVQWLVSNLRETEVTLSAFGPTNASKFLRRALEKASIQVEEAGLSKPVSSEILREVSGDIAIVGMSGRFPGGENIEEFWKALEKGRDLHTKVFVLPSLRRWIGC